jgi:muramoyltetrapeptide carboxypeptidase LdcA involved in peptidoglycan recycling
VKRAEIVSGDWELTDMAINMQGKILLLKTISVQQKELHRNFERVPDDLNLPDAAGLLLKQSLVADKR